MINFQEMGRRARIYWTHDEQPLLLSNFALNMWRVEFKACKHFCDQAHRRPLCCRCVNDNRLMRKCQVCRHVMKWTRK